MLSDWPGAKSLELLAMNAAVLNLIVSVDPETSLTVWTGRSLMVRVRFPFPLIDGKALLAKNRLRALRARDVD